MPGATFLSGESVDLRTIEKDDLEFVRDTVNDPAVRRNLASSVPCNMAMEDWFENRVSKGDDVKLLIWADGERVGNIGLNGLDATHGHAEVGYFVASGHQGRGYGGDALRTLTRYAFEERRLRTIYAHVFSFNEASTRLLESVGYEHTGRIPDWGFADGEYHDALIYAATADDWSSSG
ncbi:GNAT family N-acetyltransferase [Haloarchaeobius sp. TZWWS8]|uniref:GNAT family N-acetyltransferase n=1 Tax=Haloarchaeobius sp. TZWWS8 TaxID=3446121 RepID=UPI003EBE842B